MLTCPEPYGSRLAPTQHQTLFWCWAKTAGGLQMRSIDYVQVSRIGQSAPQTPVSING